MVRGQGVGWAVATWGNRIAPFVRLKLARDVYSGSGQGFVNGIFAKMNAVRALALLAGMALLYFAARRHVST